MSRREKRYHFLYKTTNLLNGKFYVGMHSTDDMDDGYLGSGLRLRRSIRKYGSENFQREVLEFFESRKVLAERENHLVNDDLLKEPLCMNLRNGGEGGLISEEHHLKMRAGARKFTKEQWKNSEFKKEHIKRQSEKFKKLHKSGKFRYDNFKNKKHTDEIKLQIGKTNSVKQSGQLNSQFGSCWITNGKENKKIKKSDIQQWLDAGWIKGRRA